MNDTARSLRPESVVDDDMTLEVLQQEAARRKVIQDVILSFITFEGCTVKDRVARGQLYKLICPILDESHHDRNFAWEVQRIMARLGGRKTLTRGGMHPSEWQRCRFKAGTLPQDRTPGMNTPPPGTECTSPQNPAAGTDSSK